VTFFSDYLNVDLQRTSLDNVDIPSADVDDIDFITRVTGIAPHHYDEPPPSASHIFDNRKMFGSSNIPLYLSTQRLRI
jgi:hypothetical protein